LRDELKALGAPYVEFNNDASGPGLYDQMSANPDATFVIDDVAKLEGGKKVVRLLLAALDTKAVRLVTRGKKGGGSFVFNGGVVLVANYDLADEPQLRALETRVTVLHHCPSHEELLAPMRRVAARDYEHAGRTLPAVRCQEVLEFVVEHLGAMRRPLDLRMLAAGFDARLQWENRDSETHWEQLIVSHMRKGRAPAPRRAERVEDERAFLRGLTSLPRREKLEAWKAATGKSQAAMYRRLKELGESEKVRKSQILTLPGARKAIRRSS
jgi:hypothetical protein